MEMERESMRLIGRAPADEPVDYGAVPFGKSFSNDSLNENIDVFLDVSHPHLILICGKRGTGKSYSMGNIIESIFMEDKRITSRTSAIVVDTMGIYYSFKKINKTLDKEEVLLQNISSEQVSNLVKSTEIIIPGGLEARYKSKNLTFTKSFSFLPYEIQLEDWCSVFDFEPTSAMALLFQRILDRLRVTSKDGNYTLENILDEIDYLFEILEEEPLKRKKMFKQLGYVNVKSVSLEALKARVNAAKNWGIFSENGEPIENLIQPGRLTILDLSLMQNIQGIQNLRGLILGLLLRKLYETKKFQRRIFDEKILNGEIDDDKSTLLWVFVDEAHQFFPSNGSSPASPVFSTLVREGRQPGFSLVFATQQPGKIHSDAISQCDIVISHRIDSQSDIQALNNIKYAYMKNELMEEIKALPLQRGYAIILDDNTNSIFTIRVKKRISSHQGGEPDLTNIKITMKNGSKKAVGSSKIVKIDVEKGENQDDINELNESEENQNSEDSNLRTDIPDEDKFQESEKRLETRKKTLQRR